MIENTIGKNVKRLYINREKSVFKRSQQVDTTRDTARAVDTGNTTRRHSKRFQEAEAEVEVVALGVINGE